MTGHDVRAYLNRVVRFLDTTDMRRGLRAAAMVAAVPAAIGLLADCGPLYASPPIDEILVDPSVAEIAVNEVQQFTATATYQDGTTEDVTNTAEWASSEEDVAAISQSGEATAEGVGEAIINARDMEDGAIGTSTLTVTP